MKTIAISGKSVLVGLVGWPVKDSLSPAMYNAAFAHKDLDWAYLPLPVKPGDVRYALRGLSTLNFVGCNVTIPHKQAISRYLDNVSEPARITGSVNTIHIKEGILYGYNTDAIGFLNALIQANCHPKGMRVAIFGAGKAARDVVFALVRAKADLVTVFNRTAGRAAFLVDDLVDVFPDSRLDYAPLTGEALATLGDDVDLVVNTTSVGMLPKIEACPWPTDIPLPKQAIICDLVYTPLETKLLCRARADGLTTIDGLGMLIHQRAYAFELWTDHIAPIEIMRQACLDGLVANPSATE